MSTPDRREDLPVTYLDAPWAKGISPDAIQIVGDLAARSPNKPIPEVYADPPNVSWRKAARAVGLVTGSVVATAVVLNFILSELIKK